MLFPPFFLCLCLLSCSDGLNWRPRPNQDSLQHVNYYIKPRLITQDPTYATLAVTEFMQHQPQVMEYGQPPPQITNAVPPVAFAARVVTEYIQPHPQVVEYVQPPSDDLRRATSDL